MEEKQKIGLEVLSDLLRGDYTPPNDPTAEQAIYNVAQAGRRIVGPSYQDIHVVHNDPNKTPWLTLGREPTSLAEAALWQALAAEERGKVRLMVKPGTLAPPHILQRLLVLKRRLQELTVAKTRFSQAQKPIVNLSEDAALLAAVKEVIHHIFERAKEAGVEPEMLMDREQAATLRRFNQYVRILHRDKEQG